jgi:hypothetical protein
MFFAKGNAYFTLLVIVAQRLSPRFNASTLQRFNLLAATGMKMAIKVRV